MNCSNNFEADDKKAETQRVMRLSVGDKYEALVDKGVAKLGRGLSVIADKVDRDRKVLKYISTSQEVKDIAAVVNAHRNDNVNMAREAAKLFDFIDKEVSKEDGVLLTRALGGDADGVPPHLQGVYDKFRTLIDSNAKELVKVGALAEENSMKNYLKRYYKKYLEEHKKSSLAMSKLHKRKDLTLDERLDLEMVEDAGFVIANTLLDQKKQLAKYKMLKQFDDAYGVSDAVDGYTKVPDVDVGGGVKKWGAMSGRYIPDDVYMHLEMSGEIADAMSLLDKSWLTKAVDHIKVNVTVKNPGTHLFNILSNVQVSFLNGDLGALREVLFMPKEKRKELFELARAHGLSNELAEFEKVHQSIEAKILKKPKENWIKTVAKELYLAEGTRAGEAIRKAYAMEDEIFKVAGFYKRLKKLNTKDPVKIKQALNEGMADYVDYGTPLPPLVRRLDKNGLFPFSHYVWKSTPRVALIIAKNPLKYLALQTALYSINGSVWDDGKDDYAKPEWAKEKGLAGLFPFLPSNLFAAKQWVHTYDDNYINLGRSLPGMRLSGLSIDLGFVGAFSALIQGRDPLHKSSLYKDTDTKPVAIAKTVIKTSQNYLPSLTFGRYGQQWTSILAGNPQKNHYGKDLTMEESAQRIVGVRKFNQSKEITNSMKDVMKQWKYDNISDDEMQSKLKDIEQYAIAEGVHIDRKKVSASLRKTKRAKSKIKKDWAYTVNKVVNKLF